MKNEKIKFKLKKMSIQLLELIIGSLCMSLGTVLFLLPNQLSTGGFTGIATVFYYIFKIPLGVTILILNIPFLIFGFFRVGKEFLFKSIIGTILLSVFIDIFDGIQSFTSDRLLSSIYGGILTGIGTAIILKAGGSTGRK